MTSVTSWTLNVQCIKECNQIPMVVAQSLISNIKIHCVGACGVKRRSYQILNNYVSKARSLCNLTWCTALWKSDIPMKIRHYDR